MSKTLKLAAAAAVFATPALAAPTNMENPLYMPTAGTIYSKTSAGYMFKITDDTRAQQDRNHHHQVESPIYRFHEELGIGITDNLTLAANLGYTLNDRQDRKGLHLGRLGLNYRIFEDASEIVWDVYADAHLGGVSAMTGTYDMVPDANGIGFKYDNYGTGQYGVYVGTRVGKTWGDVTGVLYTEVGHFFAGDNTEITVDAGPTSAAVGGLTAVAKLKSFTDFTIGTKWSYEIDTDWTAGFGLAWKHHARHIVDSAKLTAGTAAAQPTVDASGMAAEFAGMDFQDSFNEFPVTLSIANQVSEYVQVALYGEYTFDNGHHGSQNTTDSKIEMGVRLNAQF
ncbi:MAG: hypothetical protein LBR41_01740 [Rickettsiales bacterium]|jgi:hypothetical protein|nr:hypothetical protein [Rickettsiales bacterium]